MKTRYKILLILGIMFLILFASFVILKITFYKTWMNNDWYFHHPFGYEVECEFRLFGEPDLCIALDDKGRIIEVSTELGDWKKVHHGPTPFGYDYNNQEQCQNNGDVWYTPYNHCIMIIHMSYCLGCQENESDSEKWVDDPDYCREQNGVWNATVSGCYGLYKMCEDVGKIPRFLKDSIAFPDTEENKPIQYLMDCVNLNPDDDFFIEDNYLKYDMCTRPILEYLDKYSNLLDEDFNGNWIMNEPGLPDGITDDEFHGCFDYILEKRLQQ